MAEVREIEKEDALPEGDWVLIESRGKWSYVAKGSAAGKNDATFFTPPGFTTLDDAINASLAWAELNEVPVVYVRKS
jgi:hypothetical protein